MWNLNEWNISFLPAAKRDLVRLSNNEKALVLKAITKVRQNPLPSNEGGYGKPLGNKNGKNLAGLYKIKLRSSGIRIVYQLIRSETEMRIVVIGVRSDDEVYDEAARRKKKYNN